MNAGLLTQRIKVEKPVTVQDAYGSNNTEWTTVIESLHADVEYRHGNQLNSNGEIIYSYEVSFYVRFNEAIAEYMRITWQTRKYRILAIDRQTRLRRFAIRCELINE
jgi:SPP1 family predicted phage head-tail adaptor